MFWETLVNRMLAAYIHFSYILYNYSFFTLYFHLICYYFLIDIWDQILLRKQLTVLNGWQFLQRAPCCMLVRVLNANVLLMLFLMSFLYVCYNRFFVLRY